MTPSAEASPGSSAPRWRGGAWRSWSTLTPPTVAWEDWLLALPAVLPPLLVSALFAARLMGVGWLGGTGLSWAGGGLAVASLLAAWVLHWRGWPGALASLSTALALALVAPAMVITAMLTARALSDPTPAVVMPAVAALGMLVAAVGLVLGCLARLGAPALLWAPGLMPSAGLLTWLMVLSRQPAEPVVWGALALTFGLAAPCWFASGLLVGRWRLLPAALALLILWLLAVLIVPPSPASSRATGLLLLAQGGLAATVSVLTVAAPLIYLWWRARARRTAAAAL